VKYAQLRQYTNEIHVVNGVISWLDVRGVEDRTLRVSLPAVLDLNFLH
jgi:hypothetical protein